MAKMRRNLSKLLEKTKKSILLLGPRQVGKSTMIAGLGPNISINLADEREYLRFTRSPDVLFQRLEGSKNQSVFIDEVQRLPSLLNSVQPLIDDKPRGLRFFLTGSSARKLRRGQANLLPGRVLSFRMGPIVSSEMAYQLRNQAVLSYGTLPGILTADSQFDREQTLLSYAATYVREEIQAEALTRNLEGFSRFLTVVASRATEFLDYAKFSNEAAINRESARRYFEILEDTLIVESVRPFGKSLRRRIIQHPRYFFFDNGVLNGLLESFESPADRQGRLFENLLATQILHSARMAGKSVDVSSYRTEHGAEVDFIVDLEGKIFAIEAKVSSNARRVDLGGFKSFAEVFGKKHEAVIATLGEDESTLDGVHIMPWQMLLRRMGI